MHQHNQEGVQMQALQGTAGQRRCFEAYPTMHQSDRVVWSGVLLAPLVSRHIQHASLWAYETGCAASRIGGYDSGMLPGPPTN